MIGLVIFGVASLLGGLATSEGTCWPPWPPGLGAALASPAALALIATTFPAARPATAPSRSTPPCQVSARPRPAARRLADRHRAEPLRHRHRRLAARPADQPPIGIATAILAPRFLAESESHPGELDLPAPPPERSACSASSTASAAPARTAGPTLDAGQPGRRPRAARPLRVSRAGSRTRCCRSGSSPTAPGRPASWRCSSPLRRCSRCSST